MADQKISELNTASAVYDADDFALVQDGETKQVNASTVKAYAKDGLSKSDVGLGNVTNDAQLKIASNLSDLNNAATARTNLGLVIGTDVQAYDADLTAWAGKTAPTGDAVGTSDTQTLTNKTISGSSNTLSNIGNASLTNSSITINGNAVSLGGSTTVSAATTNTLTIGTGLSGTSFNGSAATTIAIDSTVVTLTGTQTLTNKTLTSPSISGGTANNVAIGGTTPAAGNFTTLGTTGNVTLGDASGDTLTINAGTTTFAQGTANGVAYLNGSKVLTTGSALTFDGNSFNLVSAGIYPLISVAPTGNDAIFGYRLNAAAGNGRDWRLEQGRSAAGELNFSDLTSNAIRYAIKADGTSIWNVGAGTGFDRMRLTSKGLLVGYTDDGSLSSTGNAIFSGNVGIGTSSPLARLVVSNGSNENIEFSNNASINGGVLQYINRSSASTRPDMNYYLSGGGGSHKFYTSDIERLRLDSSGNLGLGVTPNTWQTAGTLQGKGFSISPMLGVDQTAWATGCYQDTYSDFSGWKSKGAYSPTLYAQSGTRHTWCVTGQTFTGAGQTVVWNQAMTLNASGNLLVGTTTNTARLTTSSDGGEGAVEVSFLNGGCQFFVNSVGGGNAAATVQRIGKNSVSNRSINAGGTLNASGADYAEYMVKSGNFEIAKGDVCGIDSNGKLTNVFADAVSFVVKSTDPSYVGNDSWGAGIEDKDTLEAERQKVDRIAFAGQVPVNVLGANPGDYIIPVADSGSIKGETVSSPTFEQYQIAVGKVIAIESDGRARIIVKVA